MWFMNCERHQFIPLAELKANHLLQPKGLTGEELLAEAYEVIGQDYRLDSLQKEKVTARMGELAANITVNQPILLLERPTSGKEEIVEAGYAASSLGLDPDGGFSKGNQVLNVPFYNEDYSGGWHISRLEYSMWSFTVDAAQDQQRLLVGEEEIKDWLQWRGLANLRLQNPTEFHLARDAALIEKLRKGRIPFEYLGLTAEEHEKTLGFCLDRAMHYGSDAAYKTLEYAASISAQEDKNAFYGRLADTLSGALPVVYTDANSAPLIRQLFALAGRMDAFPGLVLPAGERTKCAAFMAMLYKKRADQLAGQPEDEPLQPPARLPYRGPWPENHQLNIYGNASPHIEEVWQDIDRINYLRTHNMPVDVLQRTDARVKTIEAAFTKVLIERATPADMHRIFDALEYVFEVTGERLAGHYRMVLQTVSSILPVGEVRGSIDRVAALASVLVTRIPHPPTGSQGQPLNHQAASATLIAGLYKRRLVRLQQADQSAAGDASDVVTAARASTFKAYLRPPVNLDAYEPPGI